MSAGIEIRAAYMSEWDAAMRLAWKTFLKFEGEEYSDEGIRNFWDFITGDTLERMFRTGVYQLFVALHHGEIVGMISMRGEHHISLLFVDEAYHRKGIGRALIAYLSDYLCREMGERSVTVNASPYGEAFYHALGFCDRGSRMQTDGIIYTPMELVF